MRKEDIIRALTPWNFWERRQDSGIARSYYVNEALTYLKTNKIVTITGIRRAGKSFIARQIAAAFVNKAKDSLIINFEEARFEESLDKNFLVKVYDAYLSMLKPDKKPLIILDEIQEVEEWEKFARSVNEKGEAFLVVTGSNTEIMSQEFATLLTGRTLAIEVFTLSFAEFLKFRGVEVKSEFELLQKTGVISELFNEYSSFGGFPEVVLQGERELKLKVLRSYYEDIVNKDIIKRCRIRRIDKLERIAFYYITNFSSQITFNRIGKFLKLSEKIVEIYSKCIESSKLIFFIKRFSSSIKEQENSPRKIYLTDIGLHQISNVLFSDKISKIYENIVAIELVRRTRNGHGRNLFYWKDYASREVDFVVKEGMLVKELIQVCYDAENQKTKEREIKSLLNAMKQFKLSKALVITEDCCKEEEIEGKKIVYVPLWEWLLSG